MPVECATRLLAKVQTSAKPKPLHPPAQNLMSREDYISSISAALVLKGLRKVRLFTTAPTIADLPMLQVRTELEIKLRKAGLIIDERTDALFHVFVAATDVDPTGL